MLDHLKKTFGLTEASSAEVNANQVSELNTQLSELSSKFEEAQSVNLALTEQVAQLASQLQESQTKLAEMTAKAEAEMVNAAKVKADARMSKLVETVGSVKAEGLFAATKDMDDVGFDAIVGAVAATYKSEEESPLFKEVGATAEVDVASVTEKSALQKRLEEKYSASK